MAALLTASGDVLIPEVLRPYPGLRSALTDWATLEPKLRDLETAGHEAVTDFEMLAPVRFPSKLVCVGANYRDHIAEMGDAVIPDSWSPYFFVVPGTTTLIGDGQVIEIPADPAYRVDWEAELAIVIGTGGAFIEPDEAMRHIAGYSCFSDITARGLLRRQESIAPPFTWDWAASKGMNTFSPMGPMTPAWQVDDPEDLSLRCLVNGVLKQDGSTSNFISGLAEIVSAASKIWTLEPGDVIATGTPAGVGAPRGEQLHDGDEVVVQITGLASLRNPVRASSRAGALTPTVR